MLRTLKKRGDVAHYKAGGGAMPVYSKGKAGMSIIVHIPIIKNDGLLLANNERIEILLRHSDIKYLFLGVPMGCRYRDNLNAKWKNKVYFILIAESVKLRRKYAEYAFFNGHIRDQRC